jgi:hypothetical protein
MIGYVMPRLRYWIRRLGWPLLAGLVLTVGALVFFLSVSLPAERRLREIEKGLPKTGHRIVWIPQAPQTVLLSFYQTLPSEKSLPDQLEKILDAAYENNIDLMQGHFKLTRDPDAGFSKYQMDFPANGTYVGMRKFVNQVLQSMPALALDEISFSREDAKSAEVKAAVRFTLYLRSM